jgi:hypothetical protein
VREYLFTNAYLVAPHGWGFVPCNGCRRVWAVTSTPGSLYMKESCSLCEEDGSD